MHDWSKCVHIVKLIKSSNWKCNQHERKMIKDAILESRSFFYAIQKIIDINILKQIEKKKQQWQKTWQWKNNK